MVVVEGLPEGELGAVAVLLCDNMVLVFHAMHLSSLSVSFGVRHNAWFAHEADYFGSCQSLYVEHT